jgi:hypothetical protein
LGIDTKLEAVDGRVCVDLESFKFRDLVDDIVTSFTYFDLVETAIHMAVVEAIVDVAEFTLFESVESACEVVVGSISSFR